MWRNNNGVVSSREHILARRGRKIDHEFHLECTSDSKILALTITPEKNCISFRKSCQAKLNLTSIVLIGDFARVFYGDICIAIVTSRAPQINLGIILNFLRHPPDKQIYVTGYYEKLTIHGDYVGDFYEPIFSLRSIEEKNNNTDIFKKYLRTTGGSETTKSTSRNYTTLTKSLEHLRNNSDEYSWDFLREQLLCIKQDLTIQDLQKTDLYCEVNLTQLSLSLVHRDRTAFSQALAALRSVLYKFTGSFLLVVALYECLFFSSDFGIFLKRNFDIPSVVIDLYEAKLSHNHIRYEFLKDQLAADKTHEISPHLVFGL